MQISIFGVDLIAGFDWRFDWVSLASWAKGIWTNQIKTGTTGPIVKTVP